MREVNNLDYLRLRVKNLINIGWTKEEVETHFKVSVTILKEFKSDFDNIHFLDVEDVYICEIVPRLGHKSDSYFTEDEAEFGYIAPSYNQLSIDEKIIFDKL